MRVRGTKRESTRSPRNGMRSTQHWHTIRKLNLDHTEKFYHLISKMSKSNRNSNEKVVQEGLHYTQDDGTLSRRFNALTGKWETDPSRQEMAFDPESGKLVVKRTNAPVSTADSTIAIPMAAAGFFSAFLGTTDMTTDNSSIQFIRSRNKIITFGLNF